MVFLPQASSCMAHYIPRLLHNHRAYLPSPAFWGLALPLALYTCFSLLLLLFFFFFSHFLALTIPSSFFFLSHLFFPFPFPPILSPLFFSNHP